MSKEKQVDQMENKFTDKETAYARSIIVKLEEAYNIYYDTSEGMPYDIDETLRNAKLCIKDFLYYISQQQAEIERLQGNYEKAMDNFKSVLEERADHSEAIKDFAERLKRHWRLRAGGYTLV